MQPEAMPLRAHLRRWNESLSLCPGQHSILASVIFHYGRLNEKKKKKEEEALMRSRQLLLIAGINDLPPSGEAGKPETGGEREGRAPVGAEGASPATSRARPSREAGRAAGLMHVCTSGRRVAESHESRPRENDVRGGARRWTGSSLLLFVCFSVSSRRLVVKARSRPLSRPSPCRALAPALGPAPGLSGGANPCTAQRHRPALPRGGSGSSEGTPSPASPSGVTCRLLPETRTSWDRPGSPRPLLP